MDDALILLVEDDPATCRLLSIVLENASYRVAAFGDGQAALDYLMDHDVDLLVTDIRLREISGIDLLNIARARTFPPEVIILTGYGSLDTAIAAIRAGAFNYLLKPCDSNELLGSVQKALERRINERRRLESIRLIARQVSDLIQSEHLPNVHPVHIEEQETAPQMIRLVALEINQQRRLVFYKGQTLHLTPIEFILISYLAETPGELRSSAEIVLRTHRLRTGDQEAQSLLRTHIRNLRRKIPPGYLVTVRSSGYMLCEPSDGNPPQAAALMNIKNEIRYTVVTVFLSIVPC